MENKTCTKCLINKPLSEYNKKKQSKDGLTYYCRDCLKISMAEVYEKRKNNPDVLKKMREDSRLAYHRLNYREKRAKIDPKKKLIICNRYERKFPEKLRAKIAVRGMSTNRNNNLHHWSYREEHRKDVIELSVKNHQKAHRFLIYDQERFLYRRIDTMELLDSREKHERYIIECITNKPD